MNNNELQNILTQHKIWFESSYKNGQRANLYEANLSRANLYEANLIGANLREANLSKANLSRANLSRANLYEANLRGANLIGANLRGANLIGANLRGANLIGANLKEANLRGANLPFGESFERYKKEVVPYLCTLNGKKLEDTAKHWICHSWENCPMAYVFDTESITGVPIYHRPRVQEFIQYFDANLLPKPCEDKS